MNANKEESNGSQSKKRRANTASVNEVFPEDGPAAKKPRLTRGARGALEQVLSLPFDIQFEIFGLLAPTDILSLGRCSRELRDFVRGPSFKCIWAKSQSNTFPTLPECPDDMTEPAYAELICEKANLRLTQRYHIWEARTRLCPQCIQTLWINTENKEYRRGLPKTLLNALPSCNLMDPSGAPYDGECYVPRSLHKLWSEQYNALGSSAQQEEWVNAKRQERLAIKKEQLALEKGNAVRNAVLQRKAKVLDLIKLLGWGEDLAKLPGDFFVDHPDIARLCQQPLTDRVLESLKPQINAIMGPIREARLFAEQQAAYEARMKILKQCYEDALKTYPPHQPRPRVSDIYAIPRIQNLVVDTPAAQVITRKHFNITPTTLSSIIEEANDIIESKLLCLMSAALPDKIFDPAMALRLATTVFFPTTSGVPVESEVWFVRDAIEAPSSCKPYHRGHCRVASLNNTAFKILGGVPWNTYGVVGFHRKAHDILCQIVRMCDFDPVSTTLDEIQEANPILECLSCNSYNTGRCLMPWSFAAQHALRDHPGLFPGDEAEFSLVSHAADVDKARLVFKEMAEKELFSFNARAVCMHCQYVCRTSEILEHTYAKLNLIETNAVLIAVSPPNQE
ncbi:hypothetical protein BJ165DRAFT_1404103 [Panaeolus papilionaceus]|nr:hypothetical protein BJ165DRAFT_1404103 [Panaeolus papilionaceus]